MIKPRVLVVDDESEFGTTLAERLQIRGYDARVATSGEEAMGIVFEGFPDVIVLDLKMPDMSGLSVLERVKAQDTSIEVIILTGHGSTSSGIDGMRLGAFDYLMKPVDLNELLLKIDKAHKRKNSG